MRSLSQLDLIVVAVYLLLIFVAGMVLTKRASNSVDDFFIGGRHMPWWLIGISMAATKFLHRYTGLADQLHTYRGHCGCLVFLGKRYFSFARCIPFCTPVAALRRDD